MLAAAVFFVAPVAAYAHHDCVEVEGYFHDVMLAAPVPTSERYAEALEQGIDLAIFAVGPLSIDQLGVHLAIMEQRDVDVDVAKRFVVATEEILCAMNVPSRADAFLQVYPDFDQAFPGRLLELMMAYAVANNTGASE